MASSSKYAFFHCHYAFQKFPFFCVTLCVLHALQNATENYSVLIARNFLVWSLVMICHVFVYTWASLSHTHHICSTDEGSSCYAVRRELSTAKLACTHSCIYFCMNFFSGCILTPWNIIMTLGLNGDYGRHSSPSHRSSGRHHQDSKVGRSSRGAEGGRGAE